MNILVLSIDGLHNGMIGAFGNTWIQTPNLDALACDSVLFDRYYTDSTDLLPIFQSLWKDDKGAILQRFSDKGIETLLLTDDEDVFLHEFAADFSQRHRLEPFREEQPVNTLEETRFFEALASMTEWVRRQAKTGRPFFFWTHLQGFRGNWDFPAEYRDRHRGDEDPAAYPGTKPPELVCRKGEEEIDPDDLQAVTEAYAGGISVLDDALAGLIESLEEGELGNDTALVLFSCRGFSLGEHRRIGGNDDLYGENIQLPLLIRFPRKQAATVRSPALLQTGDLTEFFTASDLPYEENQSSLAKAAREEISPRREKLCIARSDQTAFVSPDWFLRKTIDETDCKIELYVKPDDRWEINDVANRCPEIVEELLEELSASSKSKTENR